MALARFPPIAVGPAVCGGRRTVAGTRVRLSNVLEMLTGGDAAGDRD